MHVILNEVDVRVFLRLLSTMRNRLINKVSFLILSNKSFFISFMKALESKKLSVMFILWLFLCSTDGALKILFTLKKIYIWKIDEKIKREQFMNVTQISYLTIRNLRLISVIKNHENSQHFRTFPSNFCYNFRCRKRSITTSKRNQQRRKLGVTHGPY